MSFVDLFKALATLLVINSHCDELLPIPAMATGGSIGDSLFFAVSGYTLFKSVDKKAFDYFKARFIRLYPPIIIATIIVMAISMAIPEYSLICNFSNMTIGGLFQSFIFPTNYHFLSVLIVLYIVYYACLHNAGVQPLGSYHHAEPESDEKFTFSDGLGGGKNPKHNNSISCAELSIHRMVCIFPKYFQMEY